MKHYVAFEYNLAVIDPGYDYSLCELYEVDEECNLLCEDQEVKERYDFLNKHYEEYGISRYECNNQIDTSSYSATDVVNSAKALKEMLERDHRYIEIKEEKTMKKTFVNLTPHAINIITEDRQPVATFESEGVARVATKSVQKDVVDEVPIFATKYGKIEGLPEPRPNTFYIVSMLCKQACPNRKDLLSPSQLIRDENGQPVGCLGLE